MAEPPESRNSDYDALSDARDAQVVPNEAVRAPDQRADIVTMEQEPLNIHDVALNPFNQRLDFNVLMVLNNYGVDNDVLERFATNNITFAQLCYLEDGDLLEMGILDANLRSTMLDDFQSYQNQDRNSLSGVWARRELSIIDFIHQQLTRMDTLIAATMLNIGANPLLVHAPGVVLNSGQQQFFSPEAVLQLLSGMSDHISAMQRIVADLRDEDVMYRATQNIERRQTMRYTLRGFIGVLLVGAGVLLHKRFGGK